MARPDPSIPMSWLLLAAVLLASPARAEPPSLVLRLGQLGSRFLAR